MTVPTRRALGDQSPSFAGKWGQTPWVQTSYTSNIALNKTLDAFISMWNNTTPNSDWKGWRNMKTMASVDISSEGSVAIVSFASGCISDVQEITAASETIRQYVQTNPPHEVIFDFSGVKFFSSQVLGLLLEARGYVKPHGGHVAICALDPQLHRVFKITNLDRIFAFHPDRQTALAESASRGE